MVTVYVPSPVFAATPEDEEALMLNIPALHEEAGIFSLDIECARDLIHSILNSTNNVLGTIGVIRGEDPNIPIEGMIGLVFNRYWYSKDWYIDEVFNFVHPERRKGNHHNRSLIDFAKRITTECAKTSPNMRLMAGILSTVNGEKKAKLYNRYLKQAGVFYTYTPNGQDT